MKKEPHKIHKQCIEIARVQTKREYFLANFYLFEYSNEKKTVDVETTKTWKKISNSFRCVRQLKSMTCETCVESVSFFSTLCSSVSFRITEEEKNRILIDVNAIKVNVILHKQRIFILRNERRRDKTMQN